MTAPTNTYQCISADHAVVGFRNLGDGYDLYQSSPGESQHWKEPAEAWAKLRAQLESRPDGASAKGSFDGPLSAGFHLLRDKRFVSGIDKTGFQPAQQEWGTYYPRIWRGRYEAAEPLDTYSPIDAYDVYGASFTQSILAATSLAEELMLLFRYVEPSNDNTNAFGHRIRELLILACTEIEAGWRGILESNTPPNMLKERYTTADYIRLLAPMRLSAWSVQLRDYPDLQHFTPFAQWDPKQPTHSLSWYDSYNATKHDRERHFKRATLTAVLEAMAAVHVIQCAQWGPEVFDVLFGSRKSSFSVVSTPKWEAGELYLPAPPLKDGGAPWKPALLFR